MYISCGWCANEASVLISIFNVNGELYTLVNLHTIGHPQHPVYGCTAAVLKWKIRKHEAVYYPYGEGRRGVPGLGGGGVGDVKYWLTVVDVSRGKRRRSPSSFRLFCAPNPPPPKADQSPNGRFMAGHYRRSARLADGAVRVCSPMAAILAATSRAALLWKFSEGGGAANNLSGPR